MKSQTSQPISYLVFSTVQWPQQKPAPSTSSMSMSTQAPWEAEVSFQLQDEILIVIFRLKTSSNPKRPQGGFSEKHCNPPKELLFHLVLLSNPQEVQRSSQNTYWLSSLNWPYKVLDTRRLPDVPIFKPVPPDGTRNSRSAHVWSIQGSISKQPLANSWTMATASKIVKRRYFLASSHPPVCTHAFSPLLPIYFHSRTFLYAPASVADSKHLCCPHENSSFLCPMIQARSA